MLVLSRRRDERVIVTTECGTRIEVTVVDLRGEKVRLGFAADANIEIHRSEVQAAIDRERGKEINAG